MNYGWNWKIVGGGTHDSYPGGKQKRWERSASAFPPSWLEIQMFTPVEMLVNASATTGVRNQSEDF
jgi:hypothetical protein